MRQRPEEQRASNSAKPSFPWCLPKGKANGHRGLQCAPARHISANSLARKLATFGESGNTVSRAESQGFNGHGRLAATRSNQATAVTEEEVRRVVGAMIGIDHGSLGIVAHSAGNEEGKTQKRGGRPGG